MNFTKTLIEWYLRNKRDLPWRSTNDPYYIWLSEIMLQQTRVAQGMPYYYAFINRFPTVHDLANASEEQVLKLWQGLGYYSRARNLHKTAQVVAFEMDGKFPDNYTDLQQLKGIGQYTAAAIASFSFNEVVPVVDGNVFRVLSRYFNVDTDIANASARNEFAALALELMPRNDAATFNQAMMEFGALQCVPKNPNCALCPLNEGCLALKLHKINQLPVKSKKVKVRQRYFNYLVVSDLVDNTIVHKRTAKGIWHNLYEFPLVETEGKAAFEPIVDAVNEMFPQYGIASISELDTAAITHKLTHQNLQIRFWMVELSGALQNGMTRAQIASLPFPIVLFNFLEKWQKP